MVGWRLTEPVAVLLLLRSERSMSQRHESEMARLREPFEAALATSRRIQELDASARCSRPTTARKLGINWGDFRA
jgi:hypothetical protein